MTATLRRRVGLFVPFALLAVVTVVGGLANSVDARGRVVDDTDNTPVSNIAVYYGSRIVVAGPDGSYTMTALPRGARLVAQKAGYSRSSGSAESNELRLIPLTITFEVKDATTGNGIDTPEARQPAEIRIGQGSASGEMVVGPYPNREKPVIICAKGYESKEVTARGVLMNVELSPGGGGCPPLPSSAPPVPTPTPTSEIPPRPTPSPSSSP